jgi:hypothetical protein
MTKWKFSPTNKGIKVERTNDGSKEYSIGTVNTTINQALRSIAIWAMHNDIIDLSSLSEEVLYTDGHGFKRIFVWRHIPVLMGGIQGSPKN